MGNNSSEFTIVSTTQYKLISCLCAGCHGKFPVAWPTKDNRHVFILNTTCPLCGAYVTIDLHDDE